MYTFTVNVRRRCKSANWRAERGDGRGGPGHSPSIYIESEIPVEKLVLFKDNKAVGLNKELAQDIHPNQQVVHGIHPKHEVVQGINPNPGVSTGHPSKSMS